MPIALPCTIGPGEVPGKLTYSVNLDDQQVSGEAEDRHLWRANGDKLGEVPAGTVVVDGFVEAEVEPSARVGAVVSVVLPDRRRLVVRRTSLRVIEDTGELEKPSGRRKKAV